MLDRSFVLCHHRVRDFIYLGIPNRRLEQTQAQAQAQTQTQAQAFLAEAHAEAYLLTLVLLRHLPHLPHLAVRKIMHELVSLSCPHGCDYKIYCSTRA